MKVQIESALDPLLVYTQDRRVRGTLTVPASHNVDLSAVQAIEGIHPPVGEFFFDVRCDKAAELALRDSDRLSGG